MGFLKTALGRTYRIFLSPVELVIVEVTIKRKGVEYVDTKYFDENIEGITLVQEAISKLNIKVTKETTTEEVFRIHNAITAYITDKLLSMIQKR